MNVVTSGEDWRGTIAIQRSTDGGVTWITIKQYVRQDTSSQGQWDFTVSETEDYVLYRVGAMDWTSSESTSGGGSGGGVRIAAKKSTYTYTAASSSSASSGSGKTAPSGAVIVTISVSGYLRKEVYKIDSVTNAQTAIGLLQDRLAAMTSQLDNVSVRLWSMGAWGVKQGYPGAIAMYQDRLIFANTPLQPSTIWMSKTGDYANFGVSDPLSDDDSINITLAGDSADGIHSLAATQDLFAFTEGGEWRIRGAGDSGAISPTALAAHQQTNIGSKSLQPIVANGQIIFVQAQGRKVYALGYDLNIDGYSGHEISIMSAHLFEGKEITSMAFQQIPDSLLWFVLNDGSAAVCTYNPEHEVIGWSRHDFAGCSLKYVSAIPGANQTELFAVPLNSGSDGWLLTLNERANDDTFKDINNRFESAFRTLRANFDGENGSTFSNKKLIARVILHALNTSEAWAAPGDYSDEAKNWQRRRRVLWENTGYLSDADLQLDNGFARDACIQVRSAEGKQLTITAISPVITQGG